MCLLARRRLTRRFLFRFWRAWRQAKAFLAEPMKEDTKAKAILCKQSLGFGGVSVGFVPFACSGEAVVLASRRN